jgi:benzodiazapine receptor
LVIFPIQLEDFLETDNLFNKKLSIFAFTFIALVLGGLSSSSTGNDIWYQELTKSSLNPPGYVFGIVWPILYVCMSISAYRVFEKVYKIFFVQLFFNAIWSWLFFAFHLPVIALLDIWLLIYLNVKITIVLFKTDKISTFLYIPYVLWLCFASYLNLFIVINN